MRIGIIGAGSFGTTLGTIWADKGHSVLLWAREKEVVESINKEHINCFYHKQIQLNPSLRATEDLSEVLSAKDALVLAVPAKYIRNFVDRLADAWEKARTAPGIPLISIVKGFLFEPTELVSNLMNSTVGKVADFTWVQFSGPNISSEIIRGLPTASVIASRDTSLLGKLQRELSTSSLRLYTSSDPIGVEVCGAVKNVLALACGMASGLELGVNAKAVLITRGILEMKRLVALFGGKEETAQGLSGLGDLVATGFSQNSRNFRVGYAIAKGKQISEIEEGTREVAEGVRTARAIVDFVDKNASELELPIIRQVYAVIFERSQPSKAIAELMSRPFKSE